MMTKMKAIGSVGTSACSWLSMANTNVLGGMSRGSDTLSGCQSECVANMDCTGIDWNPTQLPAQRCWLSGPWSRHWRINIAVGITHYNLTRDAGCGEMFWISVECVVLGACTGSLNHGSSVSGSWVIESWVMGQWVMGQ